MVDDARVGGPAEHRKPAEEGDGAVPVRWRVLRRATIKLARGTVVRPKQFEELSRAIEAIAGSSSTNEVTVRHEAHRDRIVIRRKTIEPDERSDRHKALQSTLDAASIFSDPKVTVSAHDCGRSRPLATGSRSSGR